MYIVSKNIKNLSLAFVLFGLIGIGYGFYSSPKTIEESKEMIAKSGYDSHSGDYDSHNEKNHSSYHENGHVMSHDEHVFHQLANRPWAAIYVAAFFFFMISLELILSFLTTSTFTFNDDK